jgi:hypothetical protein
MEIGPDVGNIVRLGLVAVFSITGGPVFYKFFNPVFGVGGPPGIQAVYGRNRPVDVLGLKCVKDLFRIFRIDPLNFPDGQFLLNGSFRNLS